MLYFSNDYVELHHGDCREIIPQLVVCDLLLTDPPYGFNFKSGRSTNHENIIGDISTDLGDQVLIEVTKKIKSRRHCYVFGKWTLPEMWASQCELVWNKENVGMGDLSLPWAPQHETIQFGVYTPSRANRDRGDGKLSARLRKGSVLSSMRKNSRGSLRHPTEKPVDILRQMIESSTVIGETVLDPFCGSGSTLVASILEGRKAIGIEIEEKYCKISAERCELASKAIDTVKECL